MLSAALMPSGGLEEFYGNLVIRTVLKYAMGQFMFNFTQLEYSRGKTVGTHESSQPEAHSHTLPYVVSNS